LQHYREFAAETGRALALLAVYLLVILVPLHQAAGMQRDFAKLGYETEASWSICAPLGSDGDQSAPQIKCPAHSIGKNDLALPDTDLGFAWTEPESQLVGSLFSDAGRHNHSSINVRLSGPRAPPADA